MSTLALSGWAQYPESIGNVVPADAEFFSYGECDSVDACFASMAKLENKTPDVAVGWSLGGQLLARAISMGVIRPKRLVLMGAPFQLIADKRFPGGVNKMLINTSRMGLMASPTTMLEQFQTMFLAQGDDNAQAIKRAAKEFLATEKQFNWLFWYDELMRFSCFDLDFSGFPPTDVIHGTNDFVIPFANAGAFCQHIAGAKLHRMEQCGHAPHWHDAGFVQSIING